MMNKQHDDYQLVPYSKVRRVLGAMYPAIQRRPLIHGLLEVDVTKARAFLREHEAKTGVSLSFTAFIIMCLAQAVDENKALHAYRKGKKHLVLFDEVDVATFIEREVAGHSQPISYIIRAANKRTFREIHQEIRRAQVEHVEALRDSFNPTHWVTASPSTPIDDGLYPSSILPTANSPSVAARLWHICASRSESMATRAKHC